MAELPEAVRDQFRNWGKKGGRPRTAPHVEGWKGCRCAECREKKEPGFEAAKLPAADPRTVVADLEEIDRVLAEAVGEEDPLGEVVSGAASEVPGDMMLVSEMSDRSGHAEEAVLLAAKGAPRHGEMKVLARPQRLGDGRWVVSRAWCEMKLKKMGRL